MEISIERLQKEFDDHSHDGVNSKKTGLTIADRGDPSAYDLSCTADSTWRDWDLSAIIPSGAKIVFLQAKIRSASVGVMLRVRTNGNANEINAPAAQIQVANNYIYQQLAVAPYKSIIEYYASSSLTTADLVVTGWIK